MTTIERLRIQTVEPVHAISDIRVGRLDGDVVVIRHQAIGLALPVETPDDVSEDGEEEHAIVIGQEDVRSADPPSAGVITRVPALDSVLTGDDATVRRGGSRWWTGATWMCAETVPRSVRGLSPPQA